MIKVGLTGNIGSGKTMVSVIFNKLGVPVFHADLEAKKLFNREGIRNQIRDIFGDQVFESSGEINRKALAEIVFDHKAQLAQLNGIIHPAVRTEYEEWCGLHAGSVYAVYEAAILFESGHYKTMDKVICVTAPEELRIQRVMERDQVTREEVERRIANQWPEEKKTAMADFVIVNDGSESLIEQVRKAHKELIFNI